MTRTNQTKRKNKSQKRRNIYLEQSSENSYAKKARSPGRDETPRLVDTWPTWDETPDQTPRPVGGWDPRLVDRWDETPDQTPRLVDSWDETPKSVDRLGETRDQTPRGVDRPDETHAPYRSRSLYVEPCSACLHVGHTPYSQRLADSERWDEICTSADKWDKTLTSEDDIPDLDKWDAMLPFLKVVCQSKKSWEARDSGIKFVQQIAIHMGRAVLPHLHSLVEIIGQGLYDEISWVRTSTALSLAALAEASAPYGIISFESVIDPLFKGIRSERGETLAAFLKAIGFIIPMMDGLHASLSTKLVMDILIRELQSRDDKTVEIVLKVIKQCVSTEGVEADYIRNDILPEFFHRLWDEYTPFEHRKQLVETTLEIAKRVGVTDIVGRIVKGLKNEVEPCRMVAMKAIEKIVATFGATDINAHLEELLLDGSILYAFQEQTNYDKFNMMLNGFVVVVNCLEQRVKPYIPQICDAMKVCLDNKSCKVRQKAADAISQIAGVLKQCEEEQLMRHLGVVLHEKLAEKCPEVLGSVMEALKAIDQHR